MTEEQLKKLNSMDAEIQVLRSHYFDLQQMLSDGPDKDPDDWTFSINTAPGQEWDNEIKLISDFIPRTPSIFLSNYLQSVQARIDSLETAFSQL